MQFLKKMLATKQHTYNRISLQVQHSIEEPVTNYQNYLVTKAKLPNSFQVWYSSQILHFWLVLHPMQIEPKLAQTFIDLTFMDIEDRIARMDLPQQKIMKQLWEQCLGTTRAYDQCLSSDINADHGKLDDLLKSALKRNVFQNTEHPKLLNESVQYVRKNLSYTFSLGLEDLQSKLIFPQSISL